VATSKRPTNSAGAESPPDEEQSGGRRSLILTLAVLAVIAGLIAIFLTSAGGDENRAFTATLRIAAVTPQDVQKATQRVTDGRPITKDLTFTMAGIVTSQSRPLGAGNTTLIITRHPLKPGQPPELSVRLTFRFDKGSLTSEGRLQGVLSEAPGTQRYIGTARITGGSSAYKAASGTLSLKGFRPRIAQPVETVTVTGSIEY
jgi:hypothetical protein